MKLKLETLNWVCFWVGLAIVFASPHNWVTVMGAIVCALHFTFERGNE